DRGSASTLIFDEVDTGAGGAVADAIGVRLARLSRRAQVIAVTHAPQVAARADRHYLISKSALDKGKRVATHVLELTADKRRQENSCRRADAGAGQSRTQTATCRAFDQGSGIGSAVIPGPAEGRSPESITTEPSANLRFPDKDRPTPGSTARSD